MKNLFFCALMCFSMAVFADFNICDEEDHWHVCGQGLAVAHDVEINTESVEVPVSVTGENAQTDNKHLSGPDLTTSHIHHEVGWQR